MTVRVEKLQTPVFSFLALAVLGMVSTTTAVLLRRWRRPATLAMSEDWLIDRARTESKRGSD